MWTYQLSSLIEYWFVFLQMVLVVQTLQVLWINFTNIKDRQCHCLLQNRLKTWSVLPYVHYVEVLVKVTSWLVLGHGYWIAVMYVL